MLQFSPDIKDDSSDISQNYISTWWLWDNDKVYPEDEEDFVIGTWYTMNDCVEVWWLWDKTIERINPDDYDFSVHPSIIREKAMQILDKKFKELTESRTRKYPEPTVPIPKENILIEKSSNGQTYVYIRIFKKVLCLWSARVTKWMVKWGSSSWKRHRVNREKQIIASLQCDILGTKIGTWESKVEAFTEVFHQVYDDLHIISPEDFPERKEDEKDEVTSINWSIDDISYTMSELEVTRNVQVKFTYNWVSYTLTDLQWEVLWKKKYYFVVPEWADRKTQNKFRKRIWTTWKNQEDAVRKMLKNLVRILNGNKTQDIEIIEYLEANKV